MAVVMKLTAKEHPALNSKIENGERSSAPHPGTLSLHTVYIYIYIYICRHTTGPVQIVLERKSRKLFYSGKYVTTRRIFLRPQYDERVLEIKWKSESATKY